MHIIKCDICKKEIDREEMISVAIHEVFSNEHFCNKCGKPIKDLVEKIKLNKKK